MAPVLATSTAATAPTIAGTATTQAMGSPWGVEVRISPITALMTLLGPHVAERCGGRTPIHTPTVASVVMAQTMMRVRI